MNFFRIYLDTKVLWFFVNFVKIKGMFLFFLNAWILYKKLKIENWNLNKFYLDTKVLWLFVNFVKIKGMFFIFF